MKNYTSFKLLIILLPALLFSQDPVTWSKHVISVILTGAKKNVISDLDNDGYLDIVVTANPEGSGAEDADAENVFWFKNDGSESFTQYDIDMKFRDARALAVYDLTADGYPDVVVGSKNVDSTTVWYENDRSPSDGGWVKKHIGGPAPLNYSIIIIDLDKDGDPDILDGMGDDALGSGSITDSLRWFENISNGSSFDSHLIAEYSSPSGVAAADFDSDGDIDVVSMAWKDYSSGTASQDEDVRWWAQGSGKSFTQMEVIQQSYAGNDVVAADVDQNGTVDIVGAGYKVNSVDWWSNSGSGNNRFSTIHVIKSSFTSARNVRVADIDGDGDMDVAASSELLDRISWFENNGEESFSEHQVNSTIFDFTYYVSTADLDGDGDIDIIGTAQDDTELSWWENDLAEEKTIASGDPGAESFNNSKIVIDFQSGFSGGNTSVFYNHGINSNRDKVNSALDHIALSGYYTIVTAATTYDATIEFYFSGISEWSAITDETDLRICYWDKDSGTAGEWAILNPLTQSIDTANDTITVTGVDVELHKYSLFTLGSVTTDNPLPVELLVFKAQILEDKVQLLWSTESEFENQGFEIWKKKVGDSSYQLLASYLSNESLQGLGTSSHGKDYEFVDYNLQIGKSYFYKLVDVNYNGQKFEHNKLTVDFLPEDMIKVVGLELPETPRLYQNYPNPFNNLTTIEFSVPEGNIDGVSSVMLDIYNSLGQRVKVLYDGQLAAGYYTLRWDGHNEAGQEVASGTYIYRLQVDDFTTVRRATFMK